MLEMKNIMGQRKYIEALAGSVFFAKDFWKGEIFSHFVNLDIVGA